VLTEDFFAKTLWMDRVPSVPSYWTQRRRIIADVAALWENSRQQTENESSCPSATDLDTEIDVNSCVVETVSPSNDYTVVDDIDERDGTEEKGIGRRRRVATSFNRLRKASRG